jgi:hypothetical protein
MRFGQSRSWGRRYTFASSPSGTTAEVLDMSKKVVRGFGFFLCFILPNVHLESFADRRGVKWRREKHSSGPVNDELGCSFGDLMRAAGTKLTGDVLLLK